MNKNSLEILEKMITQLDSLVTESSEPGEYLDMDIQKSVDILKGKVNYYLSNYDTLQSLKKARLGTEES